MRRLRRAALVAACLTCAAPAADTPQPGLADCRDAWWVRSAYQPSDFDCVTFGTQEFEAGGVTYAVRAVKDRSTTTQEADDLAPLFLEAAARSMRAYAALGLKVGNVSLVFYPGNDAVLEVGRGRETDGPVPQPMARASVFSATECLMLLPLTGFTPEQTKELAAELRFTAGHESAHCVQEWNWPRQAIYLFAPGSWWAEGSADAFASAAFPLERMTRAFIADLDRNWAKTPLIGLAYETSPIFMWLWRERRDAFDALVHCVTVGQPGIGNDMQGDCLRATLDAQTLQSFAAAYFDRAVVTLSGENAGVRPIPGERLAAEGALAGDVPALALWRAALALPPGRWRVTLSDGGPTVAALRVGSAWQSLAEADEIVIACDGGGDMPVFALPLTAEQGKFTLRAVRTGQAECGGG